MKGLDGEECLVKEELRENVADWYLSMRRVSMSKMNKQLLIVMTQD